MRVSIHSRRNPVVRRLRRLLRDAGSRREEEAWVLEGVRGLREALDAGLAPDPVLVAPRLLTAPGGQDLLEGLRARGVEPLIVADTVLGWVSAVEANQGVLAVVPAPSRPVPLDPEGLVAVAAGLQDPANLGSLARVVEGAGGSGMYLLEGCVDPGNPKAVRASAGSLLRLPCERSDWNDVRSRLAARGYRLAAAESSRGTPHYRCDWRGPWALALGAEGTGLPAAILRVADVTVRVPASRVESLNVAAAAAVILFEAARQREESRS